MQFFRNKSIPYVIQNGNSKITVVIGDTYTFKPKNGFTPYTYKIVKGNGTIASTGVYTPPSSVTPGPDGTEEVIVLVTDARNTQATFTIYVVDPVALNIASLDIQPDPLDPPYNSFTATGGKPPYTFSMSSGLGSVGASSGIFTPPNSQGVSYVQVTDVDGNTTTSIIYVYINLDTAGIVFNVPVNGTQVLDNSNILVTGKPPWSFAVTAGGGTMSAASGLTSSFLAPAAPGLSTVQVTDSLAVVKNVTMNTYDPLSYVPTTRNVQISTTYGFGVTGGVPPYTHVVTSGAASGAIVAATGSFTATATSGAVVIQVTDSIGNTATASVNVYDPLLISPTSYSLVVGQNHTFTGQFGVPPYAYSVFAGVGAVNPTTGVYSSGASGTATVRVTDFMGNTADAAVTVSNPLSVPPLIVMQLGNAYTIAPTGGQSPFTFVPTGCVGIITVAAGPAATSAVATAGLGTCSVAVTDSALPTAQTLTMTFTVNPVLNIACTPATIATTNTSTCTASDGVPGYTYSVVGGAPNGTITGGGIYTPPAGAGSYSAQATDSYTPANTDTFVITVNAALAVSPTAPTIQVAENITITASNGVPPYVFSKQSGPADASVTTLTGTTARGQAGMTPGTLNLLATDSLGNTAVATIGIGTPPAINAAPSARNIHMNQTNTITPSGGAPAANGGLTTYSYAITAGLGGLSAATGVSSIFTAPGAVGSSTVAVDDGSVATYNVVYTIIPDLTISPTAKNMMVGTSTTFSSSNVVGTAAYSVVSAGGGSIVAATGVYTAPGAVPVPNPATIRVTDGGVQTADALVTLFPTMAVTASTGSGNMLVNTSQTLNIAGGVPPYSFSLAGGGSIVPTGPQGGGVTSTVYTAPATAQTDIFTVTDSQSPPNTVNFTLTILDLSAPAGFTVTGYTATSANTSWTAVSGATSYDFNVNGGGWATNGAGTTRNYTGLGIGVHTLGIRPVNGALIGTPSYVTQAICIAGEYAALNAGACTACPAAEYSAAAASTSCTWCAAGTFQAATGQTSCGNCPAGNWVGSHSATCGNACTGPTTIGTYWISGVNATATTCTGTACTNKPVNSSYIAPFTNTSSTCNYACTNGYGSAACTACNAGTWDNAAGGTNACVNCGPGSSTGGSGAATSCNACAAGSYSNAVANLNCTTCLAGYGAGYYQGSAGQTTCAACGAGSATGGSQTTCTACGTGTYSSAVANNACTGCTNGIANGTVSTYAASSGLTTNSCPIGSVSCNGGYGNAGTSCNACAAGTASAGGAATCTTCSQGYSAATASSCTACSNAVVGTAGAGATAKVYTDGNTTATCNFSSFSCPANSTWNSSLVGGTAACNCNAGYVWNGTICELQNPCYADGDGDGYGAGAVVSTTATTCPAGQSLNNTDCCNTSATTFPGQAAWFTTTNACGSWDYNCSGGTDKQYSGTYVSTGTTSSAGGYESGTCSITTTYYGASYSGTTVACGAAVGAPCNCSSTCCTTGCTANGGAACSTVGGTSLAAGQCWSQGAAVGTQGCH